MKAATLWETFGRRRSADAALGRAEDHARAAEAQLVALLQALASAHALAVDERAVARQAVVGHRPAVGDALELGVHARDALVPVQREVDALAAPDAQPVAVGGQPLRLAAAVLRAVAQEHERACPARSARMRSCISAGQRRGRSSEAELGEHAHGPVAAVPTLHGSVGGSGARAGLRVQPRHRHRGVQRGAPGPR